jgi:magnesium transporter
MDALTEEVESIAADALSRDADEVVERIALARRQHALLRRRLSPQREVYAALARPGQAMVREQTAVYFRAVVDHVVRLTEEVDMGRDLLASTMDAYLAQTNNRLSHVTTRLTLIATIFLPLNFVAGFFGMNLEILPPAVAVPLVFLSMAAMPVGMWLFFRRKGWI